jgi:small subunit ribosomal protein S18
MAKIFKKKNDKDLIFDYRDFKGLQRFMNIYGQIETRKKTGLGARQQRNLSTAVKRARHLALLPFVAK